MIQRALKTMHHRREGLLNGLLRIYLLFCYAFLFLPIVVIVIFSLNSGRYPSFPIHSFTLNWYIEMAKDTGLINSLKNSFIVAGSVSVISCILGFLAAYSLYSYKPRIENVFMGFMLAPLTVPALILAFSLLFFLNKILRFPNSVLSVIISHLVFCAPFSMLIIRARLTSLSPTLQEAAWDLGANKFQTVKEVVLPLSVPGLIAALLLTFTLSFDEFIIAWFVSGFQPTLPVKIWSMMRGGIKPTINAIGTLVFLFSMTTIILGEYFIRKK